MRSIHGLLLSESGHRDRGKPQFIRKGVAATDTRVHEDDKQYEEYDLFEWSEDTHGDKQETYLGVREKDGSANRCPAQQAGSEFEDSVVLCWRHVLLPHCSRRNQRALSQPADNGAEYVPL